MKWLKTFTKAERLQKTGIIGGISSGILTAIAYCVPSIWWFCLWSLIPLWNNLLHGRNKKWTLFFYAFALHVVSLTFLYCLIPELGLSDTAGFFLMSMGLLVASVILALEYVLVFLPYFLVTDSLVSVVEKKKVYFLSKNKWMLQGIRWIFFALSYGMAEWLQEHVFYPAFPWMRLAAIVTPCPLLLQDAAWFGSCFVSIKIVLWNLFAWKVVSLAVSGEKQTKEWRGILIGAAFFVGIFLFDVRQVQVYKGAEEKTIRYSNEVKEEISVLLVQGNFSGEEKWDATIQEIKERYLMLSEKYVMKETDVVVWPETALPIDLSNHSMIIEELAQFCETYETSLFVGAFDRTEEGKYNAIYYVTEQGFSEQIYYKQKLAPFGEYIPFEKLVTLFLPEQLQREAFLAGIKEEAAVFQTEFGKVGTLICFESLFSSIARKMVEEGAELLFIASNDSWFDHSAALYQHHAQAILRAVETGRYVLRVGNSGITSIIAPTGEVLLAAPAKEEVVLTGNVKRLSEQTNYVKYGDWWLVGSYVLLAIVNVFVVRVRYIRVD